jgi:hypothetical protein
MTRKNNILVIGLIISVFIGVTVKVASTDDTCVFMLTADDIQPNITILLDNGAAMEEIIWHSAYDDAINYTPEEGTQEDIVEVGTAIGNGFYNLNGYGIRISGGKYYLVDIPDSLEISEYSHTLMADGDGQTPVWTINNKTITLPATPSTAIVDEVKDNATNFRYSKNYLNWLFFSGNYVGDGSDLPNKSRFYYAKKAIMTVGKITANQAYFSIYNFTSNADGGSNVQPLGFVVETPLATHPENNTLDSNFVNNINNMGTVTHSPLAEGLASVGGYYGSSSSHVVGYYCQKNFAIVVSPGRSSEDLSVGSQSSPTNLSDFDQDNAVGGVGEGSIKENQNIYTIPTNLNGSTYLDDVAAYLFSNDIVDYEDGFQNVMTYTIGFMGDQLGNLFLTNTSNNGNGNFNLYDTSDEEYGKYHYTAEQPSDLSAVLLAAIDDILSKTNSFTAPVVPVTRTTSGNRIYMAFFKPAESNFWEGNVTKFALADDNTIIDANDNSATWPNGAIREDAVPYWQTKDWADPSKGNYIYNGDRNIYTYLRANKNLSGSSNHFAADNPKLTLGILGNPNNTASDIINYVRGADVFDEDGDGNIDENRMVITGDVLHSEPLVVKYVFPDNSSKTMVYFGANDGMLHAVLDETDPDVDTENNETDHGTEAWAFIPPDQLYRLKNMVEGLSHQYYIDSSPKAYFHDVDSDGIVDTTDGDKIILVCGERMGGTSYFALDVTDPLSPIYLWRIDQSNCKAGILELVDTSIYSNNSGTFTDGDFLKIWDGHGGWGPDIAAYKDGSMLTYSIFYENGSIPFYVGQWVGNLTTETYTDYMNGGTTTPFIWGQIGSITNADPDVIIADLGETWSEPEFALVKTSDTDTIGTPVFFIGGGYSSDNSSGTAVLAINVFTGQVVKKFTYDATTSGMNFSIPSSVTVIDEDGNTFADKLYVGDLGGQLWRIGRFTDSLGDALSFPDCDENINNWSAEILFVSDPLYERKFYYPPSVTLEKGYDLLFVGTGDRNDACNTSSSNRIYSIKDNHINSLLNESDLVDVTDPTVTVPNLDNENGDVDLNYNVDQGWFVRLTNGEKIIAESTVYYKTLYVTSFTPNTDPCLPGGFGKLYALNYKTAAAVLDFDNDNSLERSKNIGGGIPSKIVTVISDTGNIKLFISVGSTNPDAYSESFNAGVVIADPLTPKINFFYLWWREIIKL